MSEEQISALEAENAALRQRVDRLETWAGNVSASIARTASQPAAAPAAPYESPTRRDMLVALGAGLIGGAAAGAAVDYTWRPESHSASNGSAGSTSGSNADYRPRPYRDTVTGMYIAEGFGSMKDEESSRQAIQAAIEAASAAGGGAVLLSGKYTVGPNPDNKTYALYTRDNVTLAGVDWATSQIMLANGANCSVIAGKGDTDANGKLTPTDFFAVRDLTVNGNRTSQDGKVTSHGMYLVRHKHLRVSGVRITACDGNGYHSTGAAPDGGTEVVRPFFVTDLLCDSNNGWGIFSSATNREFHGKGIHVEANGMKGSNEYGGAFLDHSEDIILSLTARNNLGDGIRIHNVEACHYDNLHAFSNDGYGIYVQALVESEGRNWQAAANCGKFTTATYRPAATTTAEVYFAAGGGSYGTSHNSRVDGLHAPGDKTFAGPKPDNRNADWGVYLEDAVDPTTMRITNYVPGDGGLVGALRHA